MARNTNEVSTTNAAKLLGANEQTIQRHAKRAAEGERSRFSPESVRKDWGGRWWIKREEIDRQLSMVDSVEY